MTDFISKILTIILVFLMLVVGPLLIDYKADNMMARREILNDVEVFIDKVQDTSSITEDDINQLYIKCNSHGLTVDVTIKRLIEALVFNEQAYDADGNLGVAQTNYFAVDSLSALKNINAGDIIQVNVREVTISRQRRITYAILRIDEPGLDLTLAGVVG